jgi:hypothetical protein
VLQVDEPGTIQLDVQVSRRNDRRNARCESRRDAVLAREGSVQVCVKDVGAVDSYRRDEVREMCHVQLPGNPCNRVGLRTGIARRTDELRRCRMVVEKHGTPPQAVDTPREMQECAFRSAEHRAVAVVNDGADH